MSNQQAPFKPQFPTEGPTQQAPKQASRATPKQISPEAPDDAKTTIATSTVSFATA